jgi:hypothetical protein
MTIQTNRAPVLTLWAAVVAEQLGYDHDAALTMGKCVAGLNAQSKGRKLGIYGEPKAPEGGGPPKKTGLGEEFWTEICGRGVPCKNTPDGVRAVVKDKPIDPQSVRDYLRKKFGDHLDAVVDAMRTLASSFGTDELKEKAYHMYERFRPEIPRGKKGWGAKGDLDLDFIRALRRET